MNGLSRQNVLHTYPSLSECAWDLFCANAQLHDFKKGHLLLKEGNTAKTFYLLVDGLARVYEITDRGNEITYNFVFEHHFFTEYISFFKQAPTSLNMVLLENSTLLGIHYHTFTQLLGNTVGWQDFVLKLMVDNATQLMEKEKLVQAGNPSAAYKTLFDSMPLLFQRVEQRYIASYMGITPETFSRVKRKLSTKGSRL